MMPVTPHLANEYLEKFNYQKEFKWPEINEKFIVNENYEIVIQVNGKKRNTISTEKDVTENELIKKIQSGKFINKYLENTKLIKTIYVKGRLINFITK